MDNRNKNKYYEMFLRHECIVPNCSGGENLFRFVNRTKKQWCENIGIHKSSLTKSSRICNLHFDENCFKEQYLKLSAIPTKCLGHNNNIPHTQPLAAKPVCIVCGNEKQLRCFPSDPDQAHIWKQSLGIQGSPPHNKLRVCLDHIPKEFSLTNKTTPACVPSIERSLDHQGKVSSSCKQRNVKQTAISSHQKKPSVICTENNIIQTTSLPQKKLSVSCKENNIIETAASLAQNKLSLFCKGYNIFQTATSMAQSKLSVPCKKINIIETATSFPQKKLPVSCKKNNIIQTATSMTQSKPSVSYKENNIFQTATSLAQSKPSVSCREINIIQTVTAFPQSLMYSFKRPLPLLSLDEHTYCKRPHISPNTQFNSTNLSAWLDKTIEDIENYNVDLRRKVKSLKEQVLEKENKLFRASQKE